MNSQKSAKISFWCNRILIFLIVLLCITIYDLLGWYGRLRQLNWQVSAAILIGFYLCVPAIFYSLRCVEKLLKNILGSAVFVVENVRYLRRIRWCCAYVSLICLLSGILYQPLLFLAVIMAFLALMVSVVKNVMAAAVELREENDLTI